MSNEILKGIAEKLPEWDQKIIELQDAIAYLKETKQPYAEVEANLAKLKVLRNDHYNALKKRGMIK